jgi:hypothetical protein
MSGGPISWKSKLQKCTALSALEAEYQALSMAAREASWLKAIMSEIGLGGSDPITIFGDNQGCQYVASNRRTDARTKHIQVKFQFTRDKVEDKTIRLSYCATALMTADFVTKPIDIAKFKFCRIQSGILDFDSRGRVGIESTSLSNPTATGEENTAGDRGRESH